MLKDLVKANRSYRGFDETYQFTKEQLAAYVDLTRFTASSVKAQPLKYHLAFEKEEVGLIQSMTGWARALPDIKLPHDGMCPTGFIVICQDTDISDNCRTPRTASPRERRASPSSTRGFPHTADRRVGPRRSILVAIP